MRHLIIYTIILVLVFAYMIYKAFELLINTTVPSEEDKIYYQLDMYGTKRLLLEKIKIK